MSKSASVNKSSKQRRRHSLRRDILFAFMSVLAVTVILCWIVNAFFLEKIYIDKKEKTVRNVYSTIYSESVSGDMTSDEFDVKLQTYAVVDNIGIAIMTSVYKPIRIYSTESEEKLAAELINNLSGRINVDSVIEKTSEYIIVNKRDPKNGIESIEMWGVLPNGSLFLIRTALESVRQSAILASRVQMIVSLVSILIGGIFIYFFSRRFSKPVLEISEIAERMSNMDFEAKYNGKSNNEIDILGDSINRMSDNLNVAISELKKANLELEKDIEHKNQVDEMRKEFIANVSHELKTPLALISGYAEGLKDCVNDEADRDYYCDVIIDEAGKMNRMVKQIINLNQLESGGIKLQIERFDINALINNYVQKSDIILKQKDIAVSVPDVPVYVWADEFMVEEVVMNYLSNAINYCESDSQKRIDVSYEKEDNRVRIKIFNTGSNIPDESISHLWDKFYKVDKARSRQYGGSGVGLSIVKAIVEAHGQRYGVENVSGGVMFWFTLDI